MHLYTKCNRGSLHMHNAMESCRPLKSDPEMSINERFRIFKEKYGDRLFTDMTVNDEIFTKCYAELSESDKSIYTDYASALEWEEEKMRKKEKNRNWIEEEKIITAQTFEVEKRAFFRRFKQLLSEEEINEFCNLFKLHLGDLLFENLDETQITWLKYYANKIIKDEDIRNQFLRQSGCVQLEKEKKVYDYPIDVSSHFPVVFAHDIFVKFFEIINNHVESKAFKDYSKFVYQQSSDTLSNIDKCVDSLISSIQDSPRVELNFLESFVSGLENLFPSGSLSTKMNYSDKPARKWKAYLPCTDAIISVGSFPFFLLGAKWSLCRTAVDNALEYYAHCVANNIPFADNCPAFLLIFDYGVLHVYGVATLNNRIVCDCLWTVGTTNPQFNINNFNANIYKLVSLLYYFYDEFTKRMMVITSSPGDDEMHLKYSKLMRESTIDNQPQPAIFEVSSLETPGVRIPIEFEKIIENPYAKVEIASNLKPNVYILRVPASVSTNCLAILKLCFDYNIDVHDRLSRVNLAPKILGFNSFLGGNYKVILMEYDKNYRPIHEYVSMHCNSNISLNFNSVFESIKALLSQIHSHEIVHGDFRLNNIIARQSSSDPNLLTDFKVIDFDFSGRVDERYPCVFSRSPKIQFHQGFGSNSKRAFEHDNHFLPYIKTKLGL